MMRISLILSTYERPDALAASLRSIVNQTRMPDEIIVGDDGSGPATKAVVDSFAEQGVNITHRWLPHDGFRAGRMRNHAAAKATGDYFVIIDDDMILHPQCIADHETLARKGWFIQGTRALLDKEQTLTAYETGHYWPGFLTSGISNRKNIVRSSLLGKLFSGESRSLRGIRTCNFAVWSEDFARVNGFNEEFVGWGREDSDFASRLINSGIKRHNAKFAALCCHLHHPPRSRSALNYNDALLAQTIISSETRCRHGLNLHT